MKYVIMDEDTGEYYVGEGNEESIWSPHLEDALQYDNPPAMVMSYLRSKGYSVTHIPV